MNFRSEEEIDQFLASFHSGTLPRYCWTHAAHLAMCTAWLWREEPQTTDEIRDRIRFYNASQGTPPAAYHETLTRFWIEAVRAQLLAACPATRLDAVRGVIRALGPHSGLPGKRYTFDVFNSTEARARYIPPDAE